MDWKVDYYDKITFIKTFGISLLTSMIHRWIFSSNIARRSNVWFQHDGVHHPVILSWMFEDGEIKFFQTDGWASADSMLALKVIRSPNFNPNSNSLGYLKERLHYFNWANTKQELIQITHRSCNWRTKNDTADNKQSDPFIDTSASMLLRVCDGARRFED